MKKVVLFPFNIHCSEILRYNHFSSKYEIVGAIAPKGWGIGGRDIGFIDGEEIQVFTFKTQLIMQRILMVFLLSQNVLNQN